MIIDAEHRPIAKRGTLAATALRCDQVVGTALAKHVFDLIDAIWLGDNRIQELAGKIS
jgi:hypothetical protein